MDHVENGNNDVYTAVSCQSACKNWNGFAYTYFALLTGGYCVCDNDWENIIKHGALTTNGFELYESVSINTIYIKNNAVHHEWVGSAIDNPLISTPTLGDDFSFKNQWHHIIVQYDGNNRYIYVNGVLRAKDIPSLPNAVAPASHVNIGHIHFQSYFDGWIGQALIWSKVLNAGERDALFQPNLCDMRANPTICISSCDGSISFPDHAKLDFENSASYDNTIEVGVEIRQTRWNHRKRKCTDEIVWPKFYWKKILQYHDMYTPTTNAVSVDNLEKPPSEVGFAKLSDLEINEIKPIGGFNYYKFQQEVYNDAHDEISFGNHDKSFIYIRTKNEFADIANSFGWANSYETCQGTEDIEQCTWKLNNNLPYLNSFNEVGSTGINSWATDHDGTIACLSIDLNKRCLSYGLKWVKILQFGESYTPTRYAAGDISKSVMPTVGGSLLEFAKLSDADINAITKQTVFEEVNSGSAALNIGSATLKECRAYATTNPSFVWGGLGDWDFVGCFRYPDTHPTLPSWVYFSTKTTGSYTCGTNPHSAMCIKKNIQHYNGLHYYKFVDTDSLYQPIIFLRTSSEYNDTAQGTLKKI